MSKFAYHINRRASSRPAYPFTDVLSATKGEQARCEIARCPRYSPTPLRNLPGIASKAGVASVLYKDESSRFGLKSFKALGGAWAVAVFLRAALEQRLGAPVTFADLARKAHLDLTQGFTVACASDGNHGRAVAAAAQVFGCRCVVFLHENVSEGRAAAIRAFGGEVIRTQGDYDDSVEEARRDADARGWALISDTSSTGDDPVPATIMQGYTVMVIELLEQLRDSGEPPPTHVFLQAGVGGMAAAVVAHLWEVWGEAAPKFIVVEPERADCLFQSALADAPAPATGDLDTVMAGLACGEVSIVAWNILQAGADVFMTIPDAGAVEAMRLLASGAYGEPIEAGESATAGLAALLALAADPDPRLQLGKEARVLLIGTEGATDPELYRALVGATTVAA